MKKYLVSTNNYLDKFLLYDGKITKCTDGMKAVPPDGYCVELKDAVVGYYAEDQDIYLVVNGETFKIDISNVRSTNTRTETLGQFNFKVYNQDKLIIDIEYIDNITGGPLFGSSYTHFLEYLSDMLNSREKTEEKIRRIMHNKRFIEENWASGWDYSLLIDPDRLNPDLVPKEAEIRETVPVLWPLKTEKMSKNKQSETSGGTETTSCLAFVLEQDSGISDAERWKDSDANFCQNGLNGNQYAHQALQKPRQYSNLDAARRSGTGIGDRYDSAAGTLALIALLS